MQNNSIIELADATLVLAFGKELPNFLLNEMKKNEREVRFFDGSDVMTEERLISVIESQIYPLKDGFDLIQFTVDRDSFFMYEFGDHWLAEDVDQWFEVGDIGAGLQILMYQRYVDGQYVTVFDDRDFHIDSHKHSSLDKYNGSEFVGSKFCSVIIDHHTNKPYYIPNYNFG